MLATFGNEPHAEDDDRTIRLWDLDTGRQILRVGIQYRYSKGNLLVFSADDRTLMVNGPKGQFLHVRAGRILDGFLPGKPGQSDYFDITPRTYHSRGRYKGRPVLDLDAAKLNHYTGQAQNSELPASSPDERLRVQNRVKEPQSANTPTVIEIVEGQSGKAICALELDTELQDEGRRRTTRHSHFGFLAFSNNNAFLHGLVDYDSSSRVHTFRDERSAIYTWEVKTGKRVRRSPARSGRPIFITPDGRAVVMRDWDSLWLVETATMRHILDIGYVANLETVTMDPAGRRLVTGGFGAGAIIVRSLVGDATHRAAAAKLDAAGMVHLGQLRNLESLNLRMCDMTDEGVEHLGDLTKLRYLNLEKVKWITDTGLYHLMAFESLKMLDIGYSDVTDEGLRRFRGAKPDCRVDASLRRSRGPFLGVHGSPNTAECVIEAVVAGGAAERAGMKAGDEIIQMSDRNITSFGDLVTVIRSKRIGERVRIIYRRGEKTTRVVVPLGPRPKK